MYSYEDRIRAVKLYIKLGKRTRPTIRWVKFQSARTIPLLGDPSLLQMAQSALIHCEIARPKEEAFNQFRIRQRNLANVESGEDTNGIILLTHFIPDHFDFIAKC